MSLAISNIKYKCGIEIKIKLYKENFIHVKAAAKGTMRPKTTVGVCFANTLMKS